MLYNLLLTDAQTGIIGFFLGIGTVFLGIGILILIVYLLGKILKQSNKEKTQKSVEPAPAVSVQPVVEDGIPEHIKVAIMAAIYAYYGEQQREKCEFIVRKIKRRS